MTTKINKTIGLLHKLQNLLPRTALITIYRAFVRPHLNYGDILYNQDLNLSFQQKLKVHSVQNMFGNNWRNTGYLQREDLPKAMVRITSVTTVYRKLAMFYKIYMKKSPFYLFNLIAEKKHSYAMRNVDCIPLIKTF